VALVLTLDGFDRLLLEVGEIPELWMGVDEPIDSLGRDVEGVGRPVVAIDAVHDPRLGVDFTGRSLFAVAGVGADRAVWSREFYPRDLLTPFVRRDIADLVVRVDVPPVDPAGSADVQAAAAGTEQHGGVRGAVGFIGFVAREDAQLVAVMLVGPVTLLARFTGRAQGVDGRSDGAGVGIDRGPPDLPEAVEL